MIIDDKTSKGGTSVLGTYAIMRFERTQKQLTCELVVPNSMQILRLDPRLSRMTLEDERTILRSYMKILKERRKRGKDRKILQQELRRLGKAVQKVLKPVFDGFAIDVKRETALALALDLDTVKIPWELGFIDDKSNDRLSDKIDTGRLRILESGKEKWRSPPEMRRIDRALVVGVNYDSEECPDAKNLERLDYAEDEAKKVAQILVSNGLKVTLLLGNEAKKNRIVRELGRGIDIFHFTGHGSMTRETSEIFTCDGSLIAGDLGRQLNNTARSPRLSFLNACETSVETSTISEPKWESYSWAHAIADSGGMAFVGTLWPVEDEKNAYLLPCTFYKELLGKGSTLAEALRRAKNKAKNEGEEEFVYSAYVLYGPPTLTKKDILEK